MSYLLLGLATPLILMSISPARRARTRTHPWRAPKIDLVMVTLGYLLYLTTDVEWAYLVIAVTTGYLVTNVTIAGLMTLQTPQDQNQPPG